MPADRLLRSTAACGITFLVAFVANITLTAVGPNHMSPLPDELARVTADAAALRWSAALGMVGALAFAGLTVGLALILAHRARVAAAAVTALAGTTFLAVWIVSFAAVAASSIAAEVGYGTDAIMGLGVLHSTTFLMAFAPAGIAVLAGRTAPGFGRVGAVFSGVVGVCALYSAFLVVRVEGEQSLFGLPVIVAFWGVPLWGAGAGYRLLRPHSSRLSAPQQNATLPA
jgi:hypothetical protein